MLIKTATQLKQFQNSAGLGIYCRLSLYGKTCPVTKPTLIHVAGLVHTVPLTRLSTSFVPASEEDHPAVTVYKL